MSGKQFKLTRKHLLALSLVLTAMVFCLKTIPAISPQSSYHPSSWLRMVCISTTKTTPISML